ncbi:putative TetR family transcriptional regulator [Gordonia hirsuta DSM 44140 = NBRC 16056]|uniref:Putative TetR family transcriptional regulator n=1 Tax=Gordonia hirsuta DSM 44140 = NBRC 16056 TaxID=1121927 RepID=L7L910_9ACTN|nr:TetR/AcrR family transcriptional regulator [Gordonia hirsuta]GAC56498.1 putative TetR family transcriptional regulator [Gordonia hirsuta DSM 44140 = NBRC 16056]
MKWQQPGPTERLGRIPREQRQQRHRDIVQAAADELVDRGYEGLTMARVASRSRASKETLYSWFGDKDGLLQAVIAAQAEQVTHLLSPLTEQPVPAAAEVRDALHAVGEALLEVFTAEVPITMCRVAATSPSLSRRLREDGHLRALPMVVGYFTRLAQAGVLHLPDPAEAVSVFYGLVFRETLLGRLLGDEQPSAESRSRHVAAGVDAFLRLTEA